MVMYAEDFYNELLSNKFTCRSSVTVTIMTNVLNAFTANENGSSVFVSHFKTIKCTPASLIHSIASSGRFSIPTLICACELYINFCKNGPGKYTDSAILLFVICLHLSHVNLIDDCQDFKYMRSFLRLGRKEYSRCFTITWNLLDYKTLISVDAYSDRISQLISKYPNKITSSTFVNIIWYTWKQHFIRCRDLFEIKNST